MINREKVRIIPYHMINSHKDLPRYGNDGLFVVLTLFQRFVFIIEVRIFPVPVSPRIYEVDSGHRGETANDASVFLAIVYQLLINQTDTLFYLGKVQADDLQFVPLHTNEFITVDAVLNIFIRCLHIIAPAYQAWDFIVADFVRFRGDEVFHDDRCRFPKRI